LALQPDEAGAAFHERFLIDSPNALAEVSPRDADIARCLRVIRVTDAAPGRSLHLAMNGEAGEAMCWLE
jgi:hypothetical protein